MSFADIFEVMFIISTAKNGSGHSFNRMRIELFIKRDFYYTFTPETRFSKIFQTIYKKIRNRRQIIKSSPCIRVPKFWYEQPNFLVRISISRKENIR